MEKRQLDKNTRSSLPPQTLHRSNPLPIPGARQVPAKKFTIVKGFQAQIPQTNTQVARVSTAHRTTQSLSTLKEEITALEEQLRDKSNILEGQRAENKNVSKELDRTNSLHNDILKSTGDVCMQNDRLNFQVAEKKKEVEKTTKGRDQLMQTLENLRILF